jgi:glutamate-1-semialdehyde 2,1-aminomutase
MVLFIRFAKGEVDMFKAAEMFEKQYVSRTKRSREIYEEAKQCMPGGAGAQKLAKKPYPLYVTEARGAKFTDVDGNEYIDLTAGGGPVILGYSPVSVIDAVKRQLERGTIMNAVPEIQVRLAKKLVKHLPGFEMVRFANSGSEAVHLALRAARVFTGREKIARIEGHWSGQLDNEMISSCRFLGSEESPKPAPNCAGIPKSVLSDTVILPFNDTDAALSVIKKHKNELAAVIMEPVAGTYGRGLPVERGFMEALRKTTQSEGILLIWDEVITGYRLGLHGAADLFPGVIPDLRALAKIIGGGFPVGAYGGRKEIMDRAITPTGRPEEKSFSSGTYSGNPISMVAGLAQIEELENKEKEIYPYIDKIAEKLRNDLREMANNLGIGLQVLGIGSIFGTVFTPLPCKTVRDILKNDDTQKQMAFELGLLANGVYYKNPALTYAALSEQDIDKILEVSEYVLGEMARSSVG